MAPRHEYNLRVATFAHSYDVADNVKPFRANLDSESEELIVHHEKGDVTLNKLKEFVFVDESDDEDPEYVESSGESEDSLEYLSENETPCRDYDLRAPMKTNSCDVDDLKPVTVRLEWEQLIVPHEEGDVTLDRLKEFVFEEEDVEEDPEYEESIVESDDSLEYESEEEGESEEFEVYEDSSQDGLASMITNSCLLDMVVNEDVSWGVSNKAEEYIASFGVSQFGIRVADSGLSIVETPLSYFSTWMFDGVRHARRHLRAVRRAGEKLNTNSCKARSLLVQVANLLPLNALLGLKLVELTSYDCNKYVAEDEDLDDPEYLLSCEETDDSLEFRSDIESEEDLDSDVESASIHSSESEVTDSLGSSDDASE